MKIAGSGSVPKHWYGCHYQLHTVWFALTGVADPDPGSGAFSTPGPGSGIRNRFILDSGSRIPDPKPIYFRA
jgi:hypothetical protein